jgi:hypothetical protein
MQSTPVTKPYKQNITTRWFFATQTGQRMEKTHQHIPPNQKTIYIAQHDPLWQTHPILNDIRNHQHTIIPPPPITTAPPTEWINTIATIAKDANKEARKITTKYTKDCILKGVSKYRQMYEKKPKKNKSESLQEH